ncbi:MAG: (Fe-S)-binding protein, partial [Oscillospiraceae bacterium]
EQLAREHSYVGIHDLVPTKDEVLDILKQMGKNSPDDELNCGTCGYDTCREKAVAVFNGKANLQMCLPFLKEKAESFSDNIINNTPNGIIVLNENLEVQQINSAARSIMKIANASDVLGEQVVRILDPTIFLNVLESGHSVPNKQVYLAEYARYVEQSVLYDREYHILICIMRDVTDEQVQHRGRVEASRRTVEITDRVIDKQMRIAQEIASLLGETTAETKVALTKLKESLKDE